MIELALDWETYFDTHFNLKKLPTIRYIRDDRFHAHGVSVKYRDHEPFWVTHCELKDFLNEQDWSQTRLISHTTFDSLVVVERYGHKPAEYVDTAGLARAILGPALDADLKSLMPLLGLGEKGKELAETKGVRDLPRPLEMRLAKYAINDVNGCWGIYDMLWNELPDTEKEIMNLTCRISSEATLHIDTPTISKGLTELLRQRDATIKASGLPIDTLRSPKLFPQWVRENVAEPPMKKNPKGKLIPAFSKQDIPFMHFRAEHPEFSHVWEAKLAAMSSSEITRAQNFLLISEDGKGTLPMMQNYYGAHTGRGSGGGKLNCQNLVRGSAVRLCLTAPDGYDVVVCDSSGIEMRMNAWFCGQDDILEIVRTGRDVYAYTASKHFGYEVNKKSHPDERQFGKIMVLGLGYRMGVNKFRDSCALGFMGAPPVHLTKEEAAKAVWGWRGTNNMIENMWNKLDVMLGKMAQKDMQPETIKCVTFIHEAVLLPNGMRLQYPNLHYDAEAESFVYGYQGRWSKIHGGVLLENIIQALARIVVFDQKVEIDKLPGNTWVVSSTHDEVISVCPSPFSPYVFDRMQKIMSVSPSWAPDLPLDAEGGWAHNYSK